MTLATARRPSARWIGRLKRGGVSLAMAKGAAWSVGGNAAGMAVSFVVQILLARSLEATNYGVYAYLLAWVNVAAMIGKLEYDTAAVRFVGAYDGQRFDGLLHGFLRHARNTVLRAAVGVALVGVLAAVLFHRHLPEGLGRNAIIISAILVPLTALLLLSSASLQGFRRVPQSQLPPLLFRPLLFGAGVLLVGPLLGRTLSVGSAVGLNAAATAVALLVSLSLLARAVPASASAATPEYETARWTRAVRGFLLIAAAQMVLSQQADILVVGSLLGAREAGLYSVASQLTTLIGFGATAVVFVVLPTLSSLHAQGRRAELQRLVTSIVQACAAVSIPTTILLVAAGHIVLRWYGPGFDGAHVVMLVLCSAQVLHATVGIVSGFLLTMTGHEWEASRVIVGTAVLNLVLMFILTPVLGVLGTAIATVFAGVVKLSLLWVYARRYVGVVALPFGRSRAAAAS